MAKFMWAQDPDGRQPGRGNCKPDLYQRDLVINATNVIVCEGERDADTLNDWLQELGLYPSTVATCTPNGAEDVKREYLEILIGKTRVWVSGDNDTAGQSYRQKLGEILHGKC